LPFQHLAEIVVGARIVRFEVEGLFDEGDGLAYAAL
jgi:hypothetical protein